MIYCIRYDHFWESRVQTCGHLWIRVLATNENKTPSRAPLTFNGRPRESSSGSFPWRTCGGTISLHWTLKKKGYLGVRASPNFATPHPPKFQSRLGSEQRCAEVQLVNRRGRRLLGAPGWREAPEGWQTFKFCFFFFSYCHWKLKLCLRECWNKIKGKTAVSGADNGD